MTESQSVDARTIERFLSQLSRRFTAAGRLYLVGDTSLAMAGLCRHVSEIQLAVDVPAVRRGAMLRELRRLAEQLGIAVQETSPAEHIPLPAGAASRAQHIDRFGRLDVYHVDPYSTALSLVHHGGEHDLQGVLALLGAGWIDIDSLEGYFAEIRSRYESSGADVPAFQARLDDVRSRPTVQPTAE